MMLASQPIVHHPFAFGLGPLQFTGFGIAMLLAFVIAQVIVERELGRRGHYQEAYGTSDVVFAAVVGTLIGAKLYYVLVITQDVRDLFSRGGFVFWGGFMGSVLACFLVIRWRKLSFIRYADVAGVAIAAGYSVGRTGCWAVGDDYGRPWSGPLAVAFPNGAPPSTAGIMAHDFGVHFPAGTDLAQVIAVHPTQLYETLMGFVMFAILWRMRDHKHAEGWLFGVWCILAGLERFIIEFVRAKDDRFFGPLTAAQVIALAVMGVGVALMVWRNRPGEGKPGIYAVGRAG
ncbi:MAG TPA: prolipoprotein diacylglyceryl transferase [Gemmatimonadaceae bacterium]